MCCGRHVGKAGAIVRHGGLGAAHSDPALSAVAVAAAVITVVVVVVVAASSVAARGVVVGTVGVPG